MDSADAIRYLYSLGNEVLTAKLGLYNISTLLRSLGSPQKNFQSILIAGTNGKGSVAAFISTVLRQAGYTTGLYTSPHLHTIEERIQVNGNLISSADFSRVTGVVKNEVEKLMNPKVNRHEQPGLDRHPTYFEMVTAIALRYFAEQGIQLAILEVGMGGRLDATNVVDPVVAVITNVSLDHQRYLGKTLEEIATEKAGIIKPRTYTQGQPLPVVYCTSVPAVVDVLEKQSLAAGATLFPVVGSYLFKSEADALGRYKLTVNCELGEGIEIDVPLLGDHQVLNVLTVIKVIERLRSAGFQITKEQLQHGIGRTCWPGRMEIVGWSPMVLLDGAHNPAGASCVKEYAQKFLNGKQIILVFAAMQDKDFKEMGKILFPLGKDIVLSRIAMERAADPLQIAGTIPEFNNRYHFTESPESALQLARRLAGPKDVILVVGSLFLVGEVRLLLKNASAA